MKNKDLIAYALAKIAASNPEALRLAAQLLDVPPCPKCDYIKEYCKCENIIVG